MSLTKISKLPDIDLLNKLFTYQDGDLFRNVLNESECGLLGMKPVAIKRWNKSLAGKVAGHQFNTSSGAKAIQVRILGKSYYVHRIIYKIVTGDEPFLIDHIDGDSLNNRIENLRSVDNRTNSKNSKRFKNNSSGHTGVSFSNRENKWEAYIWDDYAKIHLGRFSDINDAIKARKEAEIRLGFHENHGRE